MNDEQKKSDTAENASGYIEVPVEADFSAEVADACEETASGLVTFADSKEADNGTDGFDCYLTEYIPYCETDIESDGDSQDEDGEVWSDAFSEDVDYSDDDGASSAAFLSDDKTYIFSVSENGALTRGFSEADKSASESNITVISCNARSAPLDIPDFTLGKEEESTPSIDRNGIGIGAVVHECYTVTEKMSVAAGESELFLCTFEGKSFVLKVYKRKGAVNPDVGSALAAIKSPYIASPVAAGEIDGYPYEIIPYYKNGSLKGRKYTLGELRGFVVPELNEMLHVAHSQGLLHNDIKPSNIMLRDEGTSFALIDFGISSLVAEGEACDNKSLGNIGLTPIYGAPEILHSCFACTLSDYYSLGITLYELYAGEPPLVSKTMEAREKYLSENPVPIPDYFPRELSELILGLTYRDISNRYDKDNPNNRWSYSNVLAWCRGEKQTVPGLSEYGKRTEISDSDSDFGIGDYLFCGSHYEKSSTLARAFGENWEAAREVLANDSLERHLESTNPYLARLCERIIERTDNLEVALWHIISAFDASSDKVFYWRGKSFANAAELGKRLLEDLRGGKNDSLGYWGSILEKHLLSAYLAKCKDSTIKDSARDTASNIEYLYRSNGANERTRTMCLYTAAFLFCGRAELVLPSGVFFSDTFELRNYMQQLYRESVDSLRNFVDCILGNANELDPQFEAWLAFYGYGDAVDRWKSGI